MFADSGKVDINPLDYGRLHELPPKNIDVMAQEVNDLIKNRVENKKRKTVWADADVTSINDSNRLFNLKAEKFFGKYTSNIKAALERGSA